METNVVISRVLEVLKVECSNPAEELRKHGRALIGIGDAIEGLSTTEAKAAIEAVNIMLPVMKRSQP